MQELTLAVVGIDYPNADGSNRRFEIALCEPGDPIELRPEPKNKHDSLAIAVWRPGAGQIGYLTAERCAMVGSRMGSEGVETIYQGQVGTAAYVRARFGGGAPTLPPAGDPAPTHPSRTAYSEDGFYPDEDGPEWGA